jgi:hypothetical protein
MATEDEVVKLRFEDDSAKLVQNVRNNIGTNLGRVLNETSQAASKLTTSTQAYKLAMESAAKAAGMSAEQFNRAPVFSASWQVRAIAWCLTICQAPVKRQVMGMIKQLPTARRQGCLSPLVRGGQQAASSASDTLGAPRVTAVPGLHNYTADISEEDRPRPSNSEPPWARPVLSK